MHRPDLTDPAFWTRAHAHTVVDDLRRTAPVHRDGSAEGPIWSVLSHRHAVTVLANSADFSSEGGSLLGTGPNPPAGSGRMIALSDPPVHRRLRDIAGPFFSPRAVTALEQRIRTLAAEIIEQAVEKQTLDFVSDIAAVIPMTVICDVMGVPSGDRPEVTQLCDRAFLSPSAQDRRVAHQELFAYLLDLAFERRARPRDDLVSAFATTRHADPLSLEDVVLNCDNIIVGGVQTVRHTAATSLQTLIDRPDAWRQIADGQVSTATATEELLRWTSVGVHVLRTVRRPTELAGQDLAAGDRVVVWVPAANRDPEVFEHPHELDLMRYPNRHLALGWGPHFCIGGLLARAELRILFEELVARVAHVDPTGPAEPALSLINLGLSTLPIRLHPARHASRRRP
jgi:cytochrome P450